MSWLLDTCVVSELVKAKPQPSVVAWLEECDEASLYLSVITLGELEKGIAKLTDTRRRARLRTWVERDLANRFEGRVLSIDALVAARWGALAGASEARGVPLPVIDSLIAATCLVHDLTVVTRNTEDFERCAARCFNPWEIRP
ncbi:MAG: type II toxin-antitoxin system VapC family toxin [Burkholderiales bacterium]